MKPPVEQPNTNEPHPSEIVVSPEDVAFFAGNGSDATPTSEARPGPGRREIVAHPREDLVRKYQAFDNALRPTLRTVYHPCSGDDCSPSVAFPNSRVVYAEKDTEDVAALQHAGFEAHLADATKFDPGPVDLLILLNPAIAPEGPASHVVEGGYVLANNYHSTATELRDSGKFELLGILHHRTQNGEPVLDTKNPEDYWKQAETEEEFRASPGYPGLAFMVKARTGKQDPGLQDYRDAIEAFRAEHPDAIYDDGYLFSRDGQIMPVGMPPKKGHQDDFFVFRRMPDSVPANR